MKKLYCDGCGTELWNEQSYGSLVLDSRLFTTFGEPEDIEWDLCFRCRQYFKNLLIPLRGKINYGR